MEGGFISQIGKFFNSGGGGGGPILTLTGDSGGAVAPDGVGNIDVVGGTGITTTGNPGTNTITIDVDGTIPDQFDTDAGSAIPALGILNILGTGGITTSGAGNTVTITNTGAVAESFPTDAGTAIPVLGALNVLGGTGISTTGVGNTVTVNVDGTIPDQFDGNVGSAIPALGILNIQVNHATLPAYFDGSTVNFYASANNVLLSFTDDADNTGVGFQALGSATAPLCDNNTAFGFACLRALDTGVNNTAIGSAAGVLATGAQNNTIVGTDAAALLTTGNANVIIGVEAGNNLLTGVGNLIIGAADDTGAPVITSAGTNYTAAESNNVCIGNPGVTGDNNVLRLGTTGVGPVQQSTCYIAGIDGVNVGSVAEVVTMGTGGAADQLGTAVITAGTNTTVTPGANTITIGSSQAQVLFNYSVANASPYVVTATDFYITVDTSTIPITIQLPNAPTLYRRFIIKDSAGNAATQNVTVTTVGGILNIDAAPTFVMNTDWEAIELVYDGFGYQVF